MTLLAADWDEQYDAIAELIASQVFVYIDETGWRVDGKSCYKWVFSTSMHILCRCGVTRKAIGGLHTSSSNAFERQKTPEKFPRTQN